MRITQQYMFPYVPPDKDLQKTSTERRNRKLVPADVKRIERTVELLKAAVQTGFPGISYLAKTAGVSSTKLKYLFKDSTGETVYQYFASCQMELAQELVLHNTEQIKVIAYMLCFKHPGKFSEAFRRKFGKSPMEMRLGGLSTEDPVEQVNDLACHPI